VDSECFKVAPTPKKPATLLTLKKAIFFKKIIAVALLRCHFYSNVGYLFARFAIDKNALFSDKFITGNKENIEQKRKKFLAYHYSFLSFYTSLSRIPTRIDITK
jgi:hypothetical protein